MTRRPGDGAPTELSFGEAIHRRPWLLTTGAPLDARDHPVRQHWPSRDTGFLRFSIGRPGEAADFVADGASRLLVSDRVRDVLLAHDLPSSTRFLEGVLRDAAGRPQAPVWWVVVERRHALLDRERSDVELSGRLVQHVRRYEVREGFDVSHDHFVCDDTSMFVYSRRLKEALEALPASGVRFWPVAGSRWPPGP